jgi:hypothetical protein
MPTQFGSINEYTVAVARSVLSVQNVRRAVSMVLECRESFTTADILSLDCLRQKPLPRHT